MVFWWFQRECKLISSLWICLALDAKFGDDPSGGFNVSQGVGLNLEINQDINFDAYSNISNMN